MRHTKIIATIGPATDSLDGLQSLASHGMNIARLNFSHGTHESQGKIIQLIKKINDKGEYSIAIMLDTQGPQIRSGDVHDPIRIRKNEEVIFTSKPTGKEKLKVIEVSYDDFPHDAKKAKKILIDNGDMEFSIVAIKSNYVVGKAKNGGKIGTRRHINLPGADVSLPAFTRKDWRDIAFGIQKEVDFIAVSFVRNKKDITTLREYLDKHDSNAHIVAKIETQQAIKNLDGIIDESDAVMIARGDLGSEVPFELVPGLQDEIVVKCRRKGKPVIIATHMLESMMENPMPTRAELTDIAHAASTQADCAMLCGETAAGKFPIKSIEAMRLVLKETEERYTFAIDGFLNLDCADKESEQTEQARAACVLAKNMNAKAIIVVTRYGRTAREVSRFRPTQQILAFTESKIVKHQLSMAWGVYPLNIHLSKDPEKTVHDAFALGKKKKRIRSGDKVIVVSDILTRQSGANGNHVMTVQIRTV